MDLKTLITLALKKKIEAGKGSFYDKGQRTTRISKREKTRRMFAANPDLSPWPLRARLFNKTTIIRRNAK